MAPVAADSIPLADAASEPQVPATAALPAACLPWPAVYIHGADTMIAQSMVALMYIDTGHLVQVGDTEGSLAAVLSTDLWQAIKRLVPGKVRAHTL